MCIKQKVNLRAVKRALTALDKLEDQGVGISVIRADLSTVADNLETEIIADHLARRIARKETARDYADRFAR